MATAGVASVIFEFLADPASASLELPQMSSAQRKSMKRLIEQHPEIRCESYGFGDERQLHLFKTCTAKAGHEQGSLTPASLAQMEGRSGSTDCSTAATSETSSEHNPELQQLPEKAMQVRNTFIHFEDSEHVDERVTQSMPRNMFRRCVLAESSKRRVRQETVLPISEEAEAPGKECAQLLQTGALVIVDGLVKLPAFNGNSAIVQGWDAATGRYDILIAFAGVQGGFQQAKIKEENLRLVMSTPQYQ